MNIPYQIILKRVSATLIDLVIFAPLMLVQELLLKPSNDLMLLGLGIVMFSFLSFMYSIYLHTKYGQTIGKRLFNIKAVSMSGSFIKPLQSVIRIGPWVLILIVGILYYASLSEEFYQFSNGLFEENGRFQEMMHKYDLFIGIISASWLVLDSAVMVFHTNQRALHDLMAGTKVISFT